MSITLRECARAVRDADQALSVAAAEAECMAQQLRAKDRALAIALRSRLDSPLERIYAPRDREAARRVLAAVLLAVHDGTPHRDQLWRALGRAWPGAFRAMADGRLG